MLIAQESAYSWGCAHKDRFGGRSCSNDEGFARVVDTVAASIVEDGLSRVPNVVEDDIQVGQLSIEL